MKTIPVLPSGADSIFVLSCTILCMQELAPDSHIASCVRFCCDVQVYPKSFTSGLHVFL